MTRGESHRGPDDSGSAPRKSGDIDEAYEILSRLLNPRQRTVSGSSEPRYVISVAARMVGIEAHTLRYYERLGLVSPGRSQGNTRLYSQDDVDQLCCVKALMNDLRVNQAGVELALRLMRKMEEAERRFEEMEERFTRLMGGGTDSDRER
jgi:MerR family transcriptional regulator/heat shock protein HspR